MTPDSVKSSAAGDGVSIACIIGVRAVRPVEERISAAAGGRGERDGGALYNGNLGIIVAIFIVLQGDSDFISRMTVDDLVAGLNGADCVLHAIVIRPGIAALPCGACQCDVDVARHAGVGVAGNGLRIIHKSCFLIIHLISADACI